MLALLENSRPFPLGVQGYLFPLESNKELLALYVDTLAQVRSVFAFRTTL